MGYRDRTYVIFDGDNDQWAYRYMRGWKNNDRIDFDFEDAHDLFPLTYRAQDETYIKSKLRERFKYASQVIVLIGESTKYLYKYVRWELEVALDLGLPIIAVNLNNRRSEDINLCPAILRNQDVVHISFKMRIIKHALDDFPPFIRNSKKRETWHYGDQVYNNIGL